jgi:kynurenine formamidase
VFVVENLWDLQRLIAAGGSFTAHTYPMRFAGITGIPCRVIAQL